LHNIDFLLWYHIQPPQSECDGGKPAKIGKQ